MPATPRKSAVGRSEAESPLATRSGPYKAFQATKSIYHRAWLDRANSGHLAVFVLMSEFGSLRAA
jgi:hypothetical protein